MVDAGDPPLTPLPGYRIPRNDRPTLGADRTATTLQTGLMSAHVQLGEFLRARRAEVSPESVGLARRGSYRRVAGLRREEVAQLAGVLLARAGQGGPASPRGSSGAHTAIVNPPKRTERRPDRAGRRDAGSEACR
jgi:hypothetical protein